MNRFHSLALVALLALVAETAAPAVAHAKGKTAPGAAAPAPAPAGAEANKLGANALVQFARAGALQAVTVPGARPKRAPAAAPPVTPEEEAAAQIQKLLRNTSLRRGVTGFFVADARTGEPVFAVNSDDAMNPASNVKMISTATALELLGPEFRYPTRVLGRAAASGVVRGDVFLLGSYDPTLAPEDFAELASSLAAHGVTAIEGNVVVGSDPTRDGIFRSIIPVAITAGEPGEAPTVRTPDGLALVTVRVTATTAKKPKRTHLTYAEKVTQDETGHPRVELTIGGTISRGATVTYKLWTRQRTAHAAYALIAALREHHIAIYGDLVVKELGDFVGDSVASGALPVELGRHDSEPLAAIIASVNKRSINWLADRVVMTASALARHAQPSMALALDEMYAWLARHPHLERGGLVIDTGSGLSYKTKISTHELVSIVRSAGGFDVQAPEATNLASAWRSSLSIAGNDGTLRHRFRGADLRGRMIGKTGTLSTVVALSGILDIDPARPLVFSLVTNSDHLDKNDVRRAHEQMIGEVCRYLTRTAKPVAATFGAVMPTTSAPVVIAPPAAVAPVAPAPDETDGADDGESAESGESSALDSEAAGSK